MRDARVAVFVHLVWATWDRLPFLSAEIAPAVYRAIGAKCQELKAEVIAIGGVEDHVHLLVRLPATLTVADLAKHVKGASAHLVNAQLGVERPFRWQGSYSAFSVDPDRLDRVVTYIAHQHEHHRTGTLYTPWEPTAESPDKHDRSPP